MTEQDKPKKRHFKIYTFDPETKEITGISSMKTKPLTLDQLLLVINKELATPFYRYAAFQVIK